MHSPARLHNSTQLDLDSRGHLLAPFSFTKGSLAKHRPARCPNHRVDAHGAPAKYTCARSRRLARGPSAYDVDDFEVKWCPEQDIREKCNCQKGGKKCIVRKESNGKILTRDLDSPIGACENGPGFGDPFNCPDYDSLLNFYLERTVG